MHVPTHVNTLCVCMCACVCMCSNDCMSIQYAIGVYTTLVPLLSVTTASVSVEASREFPCSLQLPLSAYVCPGSGMVWRCHSYISAMHVGCLCPCMALHTPSKCCIPIAHPETQCIPHPSLCTPSSDHT